MPKQFSDGTTPMKEPKLVRRAMVCADEEFERIGRESFYLQVLFSFFFCPLFFCCSLFDEVFGFVTIFFLKCFSSKKNNERPQDLKKNEKAQLF